MLNEIAQQSVECQEFDIQNILFKRQLQKHTFTQYTV